MNILDFTEPRKESSDKPAYIRAIAIKRQQLKESLRQLDVLENKVPTWSDVVRMDDARVPGGTIGVYKIIYKPTMKVMSIGQGNVKGRRGRHLSVFKNGGKDITHIGGSTSGSVVAQKMFRHDSNLDNWLFSWCETKEKTLASQYEFELQQEMLPPFNGLHMGGNN